MKFLSCGLVAVGVLFAGSTQADVVAACSSQPGDRPTVAGISITDDAPDGEMASLRATSEASGAFLRIYYDAGSEAVARARAACLGAQLPMLEGELGDDRSGAEWSSVVFTQDTAYVPPRGEGIQARWPVTVLPDGQLSPVGHAMIVSIIPHEQVHAYQTRAGARPSRWVGEGHAAWVQARIVPRLDPEMVQGTRAHRASQLAAAEGPINLAQWGSPRPKREAIMRQVSAEDRARMEADPNYRPTGSFRFNRDDFEGDVLTESQAQYGAAASVFDGLEARHGAAAVQAWMTEISAASGPITLPTLVETVQRHFGESLSDLLIVRHQTPAIT